MELDNPSFFIILWVSMEDESENIYSESSKYKIKVFKISKEFCLKTHHNTIKTRKSLDFSKLLLQDNGKQERG
mgnify:CR=1 FL=1